MNMNVSEFLSKLDKNNVGYRGLKHILTSSIMYKRQIVFFDKKRVFDIPIPSEFATPIFDKKLEIIFLVEWGVAHKVVLGYLCGYHLNKSIIDPGAYSEIYLENNFGWYISVIKSKFEQWCVEISPTYEMDEFEKSHLKRIRRESVGYCIRDSLQIKF